MDQACQAAYCFSPPFQTSQLTFDEGGQDLAYLVSVQICL